MNLKEKSKEAKEYGEVKNELVNLIENFLIKYKEYEDLYKNIFIRWVDKTVTEFEAVFKSEGFNVTTEISNYSSESDNYKTIKAILYDLEFELLITVGKCQDIRFLQIKPKAEKKNIIIRPTIKKHYINTTHIKINGTSKIYNDSSNRISTVYDLEEKNEKVKKAEFSIIEMKEFILEIKEEMKLLLAELEEIETIKVKSTAIPTGEFGFEDKKSSYGEFEKFSELIERI